MSGRFRVAIVGAALTLIAGHGDLAAESGPPLRIGHYSIGSGLIGFVIDRMGTPIKLRFDGSDEILALTAEQAPYNSMTLKRDDGVSVLRIYETGRILLFSDKLSGGSADAYRDQEAEPLVVKKATKEQAETEAALTEACWSTLGTAVVAQVARETGDSYYLGNACPILLRRDALTGLRAARCREIKSR